MKDRIDLMCGDCLDWLKDLPADSVDSIVTDPPYGLSFMGKKWDYDVPSVEIWAACLRVLKPGGHLLAFAGTRTQHRMAVRIEDAGFDIRDMIAWVYGSGFPKSMDVSKAIDKAAGVTRILSNVPKPGHEHFANRGKNSVQSLKGTLGGEGGFARPWMDDDEAVHRYHMESLPGSADSAAWSGWGTAFKPALEPITVARKPLIGTVAANVLAYGTGALNIDGCRVPHVTVDGGSLATNPHLRAHIKGGNGGNIFPAESESRQGTSPPAGRWPANLIHDGSGDVLALFPDSKGQQGDVSGKEASRTGGAGTNCYGEFGRVPAPKREDGGGSAARFFYCAKTSKKDREAGNDHPTVKPTDLMRYLCRCVTKPGGIVLDPFMGSGSTGKAAMLEGFRFIGIERDDKSFDIACDRIEAALAANPDLVDPAAVKQTVYPVSPRLSPEGDAYICDECGREWAGGATPDCALCSAALDRLDADPGAA
jgi:site-specific DNA-methyltransferase (adenine-specific)